MKLAEFHAKRAAALAQVPPKREMCLRCRKAMRTCYCAQLRPFTAPVSFVILQNLDEARNTIATARMAHLSVLNSRLITGNAFADDPRVTDLIADPTQKHVLLYPGRDAAPLDECLDATAREAAGSVEPRPLVFWLLDARWSAVPKMLRLSPNVRALPMVRFAPSTTSLFQGIRRQPNPNCVSTLEAMYLVIDHVLTRRQDTSTAHHALLDVFRYLVDQQLAFARDERNMRHTAFRLARTARRAKSPQDSHREILRPSPDFQAMNSVT